MCGDLGVSREERRDPMETLLVRMKPFDPRRGQVLRRYTYRGIRFQEERGWYRVEKEVGEYLRTVRQSSDPHSTLAFDVCVEEEARALDVKELAAANPRQSATDELTVSAARTEEGEPAAILAEDAGSTRRSRKEKV
jgi:hypothetical protein